jgi:hypothetical protein
MINANELRIGNLLNHNNGNIVGAFKVDLVHISDIIGNNEYGKRYEPIPLTEEILLKCGFQHHKYANDESFFEMQISKDIFLNYSPFHCRYILRKQWYGNIYNGNIEYLHQLQNLYFALTKTELEVNL